MKRRVARNQRKLAEALTMGMGETVTRFVYRRLKRGMTPQQALNAVPNSMILPRTR